MIKKSWGKKMFWAYMYINASFIIYRTFNYFYDNGINWETINSKYGWPVMIAIFSLVVLHIVDDNIRYESQGGFSRRELRQIFKDRNAVLKKRWEAKQRNPKW